MGRPRAADDFRAIRSRMEELRRERSEQRARVPPAVKGPRPYAAGTTIAVSERRRVVPTLLRALAKGRQA
jgi:hypothetical protein